MPAIVSLDMLALVKAELKAEKAQAALEAEYWAALPKVRPDPTRTDEERRLAAHAAYVYAMKLLHYNEGFVDCIEDGIGRFPARVK